MASDLGDGVAWIKTQSDEYFLEAPKALDWQYLRRTIQATIRALEQGKRPVRRAWRKEQYGILFSLLWQGEREQALEYLCSLHLASREGPLAFEYAVRYLQTQQDWIGHYQAWKEQGYPMGSGLVERAIAIVINARMKKRGMRLKRPKAT